MPFDFKTPEGLIVIEDGILQINQSHPHKEEYTRHVENKQKFKSQIFEVHFDVIFGYLYGLHLLACELQAHKNRLDKQGAKCSAILYLAAAVSDFYLPKDSMCEHKMQSREIGKEQGGLNLTLQNTPKYL